MAHNNQLGLLGEQLACEYLVEKGYTIRERNWTLGKLEVDIIADRDNILAFIEVKTRSDDKFMRPEYAVNFSKQKNLISAANGYARYHRWKGIIHLDVIAIVLNEKRKEITHYKNAFSPAPHYY